MYKYIYCLTDDFITGESDEKLNCKKHEDLQLWQFNAYVKNNWYFKYSSFRLSGIILCFERKTKTQIIRLFKRELNKVLDEEIKTIQNKKEELKTLHKKVIIREDY